MAELNYPKNEIEYYWSFFDKCKTILDVGCGTGWFTEFKNTAIGMDIYTKKFVRGDVRKLPFKKTSFDGIFASHIIEHTKNPSICIKEFKKVLKKKGILLIRIPQGKYKYPESDPTHKYMFTKESLERIVKKENFKILNIWQRYQFKGMYKLPSKIALPISFFLGNFLEPTEILLLASYD